MESSPENVSELQALRAQLLAQLEATEKQLAEHRQETRKVAIADVLVKIAEAGLTMEDLFPAADRKGSRGVKGKTSVAAKYRNAETGEQWAGRGKRPRWLAAALDAGRKLEEFAL